MSVPRPLRPTRLAIVASALLGLAACGRTVAIYLRPDAPAVTAPAPALLVAYRVRLERDQKDPGLRLDHAALGQFGEGAIPALERLFAGLGFRLRLDGAEARVLDNLPRIVRPPEGLERLEGTWTHPETSAYTFDRDGHGANPQISAAFNLDDGAYLASVTLLLVDERAGLSRAPRVELAFRVIDKSGNTVAVGLTEGAGESKTVLVDTTYENLLLALTHAVDAALNADVRPLSPS